MAATPINIVERREAVQYDGTNSGDIDGLFALTTISEVGGVWMFESPPGASTFTVNTSDWIKYAQNMALEVHSPTAFDNFYSCNTVCADLDGLASGVSVKSIGVAPVPTLLLGGSATVAVQLSPAMADSSYTARAFKFAGVSLSDLSINSVTVVDADTVNVAVSNVGLLTLTGASVLVTATD